MKADLEFFMKEKLIDSFALLQDTLRYLLAMKGWPVAGGTSKSLVCFVREDGSPSWLSPAIPVAGKHLDGSYPPLASCRPPP